MFPLSVLTHNALLGFVIVFGKCYDISRSLLRERHLVIIEHFASAGVVNTGRHVINVYTLKRKVNSISFAEPVY